MGPKGHMISAFSLSSQPLHSKNSTSVVENITRVCVMHICMLCVCVLCMCTSVYVCLCVCHACVLICMLCVCVLCMCPSSPRAGMDAYGSQFLTLEQLHQSVLYFIPDSGYPSDPHHFA